MGRKELILLPQTKVCSLTSGERISQINLNSIKTITTRFCYGREGSQLFTSLACSHCKDKSSFSSAKIKSGDKMKCSKIKFARNFTLLLLLLLSFLSSENSSLVLGID